MAVTLTTRALWQVVGHLLLDGSRETRDAEVFGGAGVAARPGGSNIEAIVVFPGEGASSPLLIAVRDEEMRRALVAALAGGQLERGEIALGAGVDGSIAALLHVRAGGTIEARTPGGTALELTPKAELERFLAALDAAIAMLGGAVAAPELAALKTALEALLPPWPAGTTVLKGE